MRLFAKNAVLDVSVEVLLLKICSIFYKNQTNFQQLGSAALRNATLRTTTIVGSWFWHVTKRNYNWIFAFRGKKIRDMQSIMPPDAT